MSPTSKEIVVNRALSGAELQEIIRQKLDTLMANEGLLVHYVAYGRVAFTLTLKLHLDNMMTRESEIEGSSAPAGVNTIDESPSFAALESPPLADPSPDATLSATELHYSIDSPNAERLRAGLPVHLDVKQPDGTVSQQQVTYPKDPTLGDGGLTIADATPKARAAWKK